MGYVGWWVHQHPTHLPLEYKAEQASRRCAKFKAVASAACAAKASFRKAKMLEVRELRKGFADKYHELRSKNRGMQRKLVLQDKVS